MSDAADPVVADLASAVGEAKNGDPLAPVTVVVPSAYARVAVRRDLAAVRPTAAVDLVTMSDLVEHLARPGLSDRDQEPTPAAVELEAIRAEALAGGGRLAAVIDRAGTTHVVRRALSELRRCDVRARREIAGRTGSVPAELVGLLDRVHERLNAGGFADATDLLAAAVAAPPAALAALGPVLEFAPPAPARAEAPLLRRIAATVGLAPVGRPAGRRPVTDVHPCTDPDQEARRSARCVMEAIDAGVPQWDQAVLHPDGPGYARMIHQHLAAAGLAVNGPGWQGLDGSAAGRSLLGLLDLAGTDWQRDRVMAWLSSGPVSDGDGLPVPAGAWDRISAEAGVLRGTGQWRDRLERLGPGPDAAAARELGRFMSDLAGRARTPRGGWADWASWAAGLVDRYVTAGTGDGAGSGASGAWPEPELAAARRLREAVAGLGALERISPAPPDEARFRQVLRTHLERTALDTADLTTGGFGDGVFVGPLRSGRGLRFHTVVTVGLADDLVPGRRDEDALLPDAVRAASDGGLPGRRQWLGQAADELALAVAAGRVRRVATVPLTDPRSGRDRVVCRWLGGLAAGAAWHTASSLSADVDGGGPVLSRVELDLRDLARAVKSGADPARSPVMAALPRAVAGFALCRSRVGPEFTRFDGHVGTGLVTPFDPSRPVSATRLETYAECPRRFLFARELQVRRPVRPEDLWTIEPAQRGTLVHAILEEYVVERLAGQPPSLARLLAIADDRFAAAEAGGLVGRPLLWRLVQAGIRRDLARFHVEEGDLEPLAAELAFGEDDGDAAVVVTLEDGRQVSFRGRADRVDRSAGGQLVVSDYKTGRQPGLAKLMGDPVVQGRRLQLPLYGMAARARFGGSGETHARYWLLSGERSASCYHLRLTEAVEDRFRRVVGLIADGIEAGAFPAIPGEPIERGFLGCQWCDFDTVCPSTRDRQWQTKRAAARLRPVVELIDDEAPPHLHGSVVRGFVDVEATP